MGERNELRIRMARNRSLWTSFTLFWRRFIKNKLAAISIVILSFIVFSALFAQFLAPYDPWATNPNTRLLPPCRDYPFGTDNLGRDILSQTIYGARMSLMISSISVVISVITGVVVGSISGYYGGIIDNILMRITDFFIVIPRFLLALFLVALLGPSTMNVIFCIAFLSWASIAKMIRAEFLSLKEREFVLASRVLGESEVYTIFQEILPNGIQPAIVMATLQIGTAITIEAGLSFLGLSNLNTMSLGRMLSQAKEYLRSAWWISFFPGMAITITVMTVNLIGDGINDVLNPKLKER